MTIEQAIQAITTVGFPIVVVLICMYYIKYLNDRHAEEVRVLNEEHKKEVESLITAINNNTLAIQKLCDRMDRDG